MPKETELPMLVARTRSGIEIKYFTEDLEEIDGAEEQETHGVCCFCGGECNPCSQACGRCVRNGPAPPAKEQETAFISPVP